MSDDEKYSQEDDNNRRGYHNLLERKRRYQLKRGYQALRRSLPGNNRQGSRAAVLADAATFIQQTMRKNKRRQERLELLTTQNDDLEDKIAALTKLKNEGNVEGFKKLLQMCSSHLDLEYDSSSTDSADNSDDSDTADEQRIR